MKSKVTIGIAAMICFATLPCFGLDMSEVKPGKGEVLDMDHFILIVDASGSMNMDHKFDLEKEMAQAFAQAMPSGDYQSGMDSFGRSRSNWTRHPLSPFNRQAMASTANKLHYLGGRTPLEAVLDEERPEYAGKSERAALLVFSDGMAKNRGTLNACERLAEAYNGELCIYTVQFGKSKRGSNLLEKMSRVTGCGASWSAKDINSIGGMTQLVRTIFFSPDRDGDGVPDRKDQCPGTPAGVEVDARGCPLDTDGDGVYDYLDKCPGTPMGAKVDADGCWDIANVNFDTNSAVVKDQYKMLLDEVATVLKKNPGIALKVQGHTDSDASDGYNMALSMRRAQAVKKALVDRGVQGKALKLGHFGESKPIRSNDTSTNKFENRRVELSVIR